MRLTEIKLEELDRILDEILDKNKIIRIRREQIKNEVSTRLKWYTDDLTHIDDIVSGSLIIIVSEVLAIIQRNDVDAENQAYLIEDLHDEFHDHSYIDPYL